MRSDFSFTTSIRSAGRSLFSMVTTTYEHCVSFVTRGIRKLRQRFGQNFGG